MLFDSAANLDAVASTGALLRSPKISFTADNQGLVQGLGADDQGRGVWVHSVAGDVQFTSDVEGVSFIILSVSTPGLKSLIRDLAGSCRQWW